MLHYDPKDYSFRFNPTPEATPASAPDPPERLLSGNTSPDRTLEQSSPSPLAHSPWSAHLMAPPPDSSTYSYTGLMGSLVREEGHIYSLAAARGLLYTGSDSKNIRVWKNQKEFSGFKANSGLVKAIIISGERIFTGHQDGKIRVWKVSRKDPSVHKRVGTLPTLKATIKSSFNPSNYIEVRKKRNTIWIKHIDAISSLSLSEDETLLYSASWDRTIKVWRISDSKCLESITAHDDAVNSVIAGFDGMVFTGSADGNVKVWRQEFQGKITKHFFSRTLLKLECAVTALAVNSSSTFLYCGSSDGMVNFWERDKGLSHAGVLRGHKLAVLCLATWGNLVFTGSVDTNICVWRREGVNHVYITLLSGHDGPVKCLAVEDIDGDQYSQPQGGGAGGRPCTVYSGSPDKSVKIWRVSTQTAAKYMLTGPPLQQENHRYGENHDAVCETIPPTPTFGQGSASKPNKKTLL